MEHFVPCLNLCTVAGGDVRDGPADLFADGFFLAAEELEQTG